jgi:hypothetical protein
MELRLLTASLLFLGSTLVAQTQDPDKPQNSPQAQLEELAREKERLQKEVGYAKERAANQKKLLAEKMMRGKPQYKAIDAGANLPPAPSVKAGTPVMPRMARVAGADELANFAEGTVMVVNGRPVPTRELDALTAFLAKTPSGGDDTMRAQRAAFDLIRIEATASTFDEAQAECEDQIGQIAQALDQGKPIAEFVKANGSVRGADAEGKVSVTPYSPFGPRFEQVAFSTEIGKRSRPFRTPEGIALLVVDGELKGERPELDRRNCTVVQVAYSKDAEAMTKAQTLINQGQIDILVRDEQAMAMVPAMFKPQVAPVVAPTPVVDVEATKKQMAELSDQMAPLQGKTDEASIGKLRRLKAQYAELKASLSRAEDTEQQPMIIDAQIEENKATKTPPVKKKD